MSKKIRKQIYLEAEQDAFLKKRSSREHSTEAEIIREAIDVYARLPVAFKKNPALWKEEMKYLKKHRKASSKGSRTWTREDLYDN